MAGGSWYVVESLSLLTVFSTERECRETREGRDPNTTPSCQLEALRGRDGRDGVNGRDGVRGKKGERGDVGAPGEKGEVGEGEKGAKGEVGGRGPQGISGPQGPEGVKGGRGEKGNRGSQGLHGPQGPAHSGGLYIRWGRTSCPIVTGTELVYSGRAGGSGYGTQFMCLPNDPDYYSSSSGGKFYIHGVIYRNNPTGITGDVPCAICYSSLRPTIMMIPTKLTCPPNWTSEYTGYLMNDNNPRSMPECVDQNPQSISESGGYAFYPLRVYCNDVGLTCPPYSGKAVTCVVCSR